MNNGKFIQTGIIAFMKFTASQLTISIFVSTLAMAGISNGQEIFEKKVSVKASNESVKTVLKKIEKQLSISFTYNPVIVSARERVDVDFDSVSLSSAIDQLFDFSVRYEALNDKVIIIPLPGNNKSHGDGISIEQLAVTVNGKIVDEQNEPLPGVNVLERGTTNGTTSDANGNFTLEASGPDAVLVFSFIGYASQEIAVNGRTTIDVKLTLDIRSLEEVVVIGYSTAKKADVTGSIVRVSEQELRSRPVNNALEAMQGKAAGVDITSNERPGEIGQVRIRGVRSLRASNDPLYVVDGIPLMSEAGIETLNPLDIESIDVLKDASATAVYGSRGANGVIIVTTKKGKSGKMSLNYAGSTTVETLEDRMEMMNAGEYLTWRRWAYYYSDPTKYPRGDEPTIANDEIIFLGKNDRNTWKNIMRGWEGGTWDGSKVKTTDWTGMVTQTAITQNHMISASGGTDKMKAYASFGYLDNPGTLKGQAFKRYSTKVSVDIAPFNWFEMGVSINTSFSNQQYGQSRTGGSTSSPGSIYASALGMLPYAVAYDTLGNRLDYPGGDDVIKNVVNEWEYTDNERKMLRAIGSIYAQVNILPGLRYRVNFGPDYRSFKNGVFIDKNSTIRINQPNYVSLSNENDFSWTLDNLLFYDHVRGDHNINATLLQTTSAWNHTESSITGFGVEVPSQKWNALGSLPLSNISGVGSDIVERQLMSYMGRVAYGFKERYLLTVSGRWDGASQLASGHKWAFFPSAALAWNIASEKWLEGNRLLDQLKLRVGVGTTGNSAIDPYTTQSKVVSLFYPYGGSVASGYSTSESLITNGNLSMANPNLGWEKTTQYNLGIDFSVLKNRISGIIDVYTSRTKDLLMEMTIPSVAGYTSTYENVGETKNKGVDITLNTLNVKIGGFEWRTSLNAGWQKDEIVRLSLGEQDDINNNWFIGESLNVIYGYESAGLWLDGDADEMALYPAKNGFQIGKARPVDQNGDHNIDANYDRVVVDHTRPRWTLGITNNFSYKNFDLSIMIYGRLGYTFNTGGEWQGGRYSQRSIDYYNENNKDAEYQKPIYNVAGGDQFSGILGYKSGSYLKIRNINLGYTIPSTILDKLHIESLRLYAQVKNPGILYSEIDWLDLDLSNNKDEELSSNSVSAFNRGFVFGLEVTF